jgi:predicted alpha/beta hydrolase family esterase
MSYRVLIVPGFHGSGDAHWQTLLEKQLPNAQRVARVDWEMPVVKAWAKAVTRALDEDPVPTVIVAHSFGCLASAVAIANRPNLDLAAVFVAPAQPDRFAPFGVRDNPALPSIAQYLPDGPLNVPGLLIGSQNDPWMKLQHAYAWARRWNLVFHDAGLAGHINVESGYGPWPWIGGVVESMGASLAQAQHHSRQGRESVYPFPQSRQQFSQPYQQLSQPHHQHAAQKILFYA